MNTENYKQGQRVSFGYGSENKNGKIVGISSGDSSLRASAYIIELDTPNELGYTHEVCVAEFVKPIDVKIEDIKPSTEVWDEETRKDNPHHYNNRLD